MNPKPYDKLVPYRDGCLLHWPDPYGSKIEWRINTPFTATLALFDYNRGRSAAYFLFADEQKHTYPMFLTDMIKLISACTLSKGVVDGQWVACKRGQNFGLKLYEPLQN